MSIYRKSGVVLCLVLLTTVSALANVTMLAAAGDYGGNRHNFSMPSFTEIGMGQSSGSFSTVSMGDVNKDGYAEIASGRGKGNSGICVWQYSGSSWSKDVVNATGNWGGVKLVDITGDGVLDLIAVGENGWQGGDAGGMVIYKGSYVGAIITWTELHSPYVSSTSCDGLAIGDIEGDGDMDIAVATHGDGVKVFLNDGGSTPTWTTYSLNTGHFEDTGIALGDLNKDNRLDIVTTSYFDDNIITVYLCSGSGAVSYDSGHLCSAFVTEAAFGIQIEDFNKNGDKDLAIGTRSHSLKVYWGNGCSGGDDSWWADAGVPSTGGGDNLQVAIGDLNKDGWTDIAVAVDGSGVGILENNAGTFTKVAPTGIPITGKWYGCCLYDWDNDGDLDLAACGWGTGVHFYESNQAVAPEFPIATITLLLTCSMALVILATTRRKRAD